MGRKWYVITVGKQPGIYTSWEDVGPRVLGVSGAVYKSYSTEEEAFLAYGKARMSKATQVIGAVPAEGSGSAEPGVAVIGVASNRVEVQTENKEGRSSVPTSPVKASQSGSKQLAATPRSTPTSLSDGPTGSRPRRLEDQASHSMGIEGEMSLLNIASSSLSSQSPAPEGTRHRATSSRARDQDKTKSRKGKEIDDVFSVGVQLPVTHTPFSSVKRCSGRENYLELYSLPQSPSSEAVKHSQKSREKKSRIRSRPIDVEETSSVSSSASTHVTYISDRSDDSPTPSTTGNPYAATTPREEIVPSTSSPPTGITQMLPGEDSISSRRVRRPRSQLPSSAPSSPVQHCQCEFICPYCHQPRGNSAIPQHLQVGNFYPDNYQSSQPPLRVILIPSCRPVRLADVVHEVSHDPRSPIPRGMAVPQQQLGSISPVLGRPSPLLSLDACFFGSSSQH